VQECDGNRHADMSPHGVYPCLNGEWIAVAVSSEEDWRALAEALDAPALAGDERFLSFASRKTNEAELDRLIAERTQSLDAGDFALKLQSRGIAAGKSFSSVDLVADPHLWERGFFREVRDRAGQSRSIVGPSWNMSRGAAIVDGAPHLGEHNAYVFGELLGLSSAEQERLMQAEITR